MSPLKIFLAAAGVVAVLALIGATAAALTPFALAAVIAYVLSPLAEKMESRGLQPAATAGALVFAVIVSLLALPLMLIPLIYAQIEEFLLALPELLERSKTWLGNAHPRIVEQLRLLNPAEVAGEAAGALGASGAWKTAHLAAGLFGKGALAAVGFFALLIITPLATFYFLRDRQIIGGEITDSLPPRMREEIMTVVRDLDNVLGEFLHGQLTVMLIMAAVYSAMLTAAGLDFSLTIGVLSGLLVFIPYAGFLLGLCLATLAGIGDFDSWHDFALLWALMSIGTIVESMFITPYFVGERIGLHPVVVLLALIVMGDWLGFVGVLLALPLAAMMLVLLRHLRRRYIGSEFYGRH